MTLVIKNGIGKLTVLYGTKTILRTFLLSKEALEKTTKNSNKSTIGERVFKAGNVL